MSAVGLFLYQSLDAIDGKQARRTNSSSPLGELFDHGCDAVSTGALLLIAQQNQNSYSLLFMYLSVSSGPPCFSITSLCCCGNMHLMRNRIIPKLDFLLWFHWDVHVLLRPLADLCVWDPALWPVSHTLSHVEFYK